MSFEGCYQILCKRGHALELDCYGAPDFEGDSEYIWHCPICGEPAAWYNIVDVTNGSCCECNVDYLDRSEGCEYCDRGRIDGYIDLEIDKPAEVETCAHCGHTSVFSHPTYQIPEKGGHKIGT